MTLAFAQIFHLGNARSAGPVLSLPLALGNKYALGAAAFAVVLQLLTVLFPPLAHVLHVTSLSMIDWVVVAFLGLLPAVAGQAIKTIRRARVA